MTRLFLAILISVPLGVSAQHHFNHVEVIQEFVNHLNCKRDITFEEDTVFIALMDTSSNVGNYIYLDGKIQEVQEKTTCVVHKRAGGCLKIWLNPHTKNEINTLAFQFKTSGIYLGDVTFVFEEGKFKIVDSYYIFGID